MESLQIKLINSTSQDLKELKSNKEQRNKIICTLYQDNVLIIEIARLLHMGKTTVRNILKEAGIYNKEKSRFHINNEKLQRNSEIIRLYQSGLSFKAISDKMNIGHTTIEHIIHTFIEKSPIQYMPLFEKTETYIRYRKYNFNIDFFENIDTEEKAYWLGFLYADGCVVHDAVKLELTINDAEHLQRFKTSVKAFTKEIKYTRNNKYCLLYLNSVKMVNDLIAVGCPPRKTLILKFPTTEQVPDNLIHHFMRGYFDGDGCIHKRSKITGVNTFSVIGVEDFIIGYKETLFRGINKKNDVRLARPKTTNKVVSLYLGGNKQISKIYDYLYKDATIYLERKNKIFKMIIGRPEISSQESLDDENGIKLESRKVPA